MTIRSENTLDSDRDPILVRMTPTTLQASSSLQPGQRVGGKYVVKRLLGRGGSSDVFEAEHAAIGRHVAIKVFHGDMATRDDMLARFSREARICGTVRHPNVGEVYDVGHLDSGVPFMVMELLDGQTLSELIAAGPMRIATVVEVARQLLHGLAAVHRIGVLHRDLKPDNVMLHHDGTNVPVVKLVDFGISKVLAPEANEPSITVEGFVVGTPFYMSPEQVRGGTLDERADLYGVGVVLYECITGQVPFNGATPGDVVAGILRDRVAPPRATRPDCPPALDAIVLKAIQRKSEARFRDAREMERALERLAMELELAVGAEAWKPDDEPARTVRHETRELSANRFSSEISAPSLPPALAATAPQTAQGEDVHQVARDGDIAPSQDPRLVPTADEVVLVAQEPWAALGDDRVRTDDLLPIIDGHQPIDVLLLGHRNTLELASLSASMPARDLESTGPTRSRKLRLGLAAMTGAALVLALGLWSPFADQGTSLNVSSVRAVGRAPTPSVANVRAPSHPTTYATVTLGGLDVESPTLTASALEVGAVTAVDTTERATSRSQDRDRDNARSRAATNTVAESSYLERARVPYASPTGHSKRAMPESPTRLAASAAPAQTHEGRQSVREIMSEALAAYVRGQLPHSRALYLRAVQMAPANAGAWRGLGMVSRRMGRRTDATRAFQNYLRLAPNARDAGQIRAQLGS